MKDKQDVISDFNELVNMTGSELESWLKSDDSNSAGWPKSGGDGDGESVGHESGRKIVEILKDNPKKDPEKYNDEQVEHMRKVVAYCKRHLAQETAGNNEKSEEDVKKTKSYASLKNWGHDFLKAKGKKDSEDEATKTSKKDEGKEQANDASKDDAEDDQENAGSKRKQTDEQDSPNKKRETHKGESKTEDKDDDKEDGDGENAKNGDAAEDKDGGDNAGGKNQSNGGSKEPENGPSKGDTVSWNWGSGHPEGKVLDVKDEKTSITTKRGNEVSKNGTADDPAVILDTGKSKAVKLAHELN